MTKIIALSARKQGGKTTAANFLVGSAMASIEIDGEPIIEYAYVTEKGKLVISGVDPNTQEIIPVVFPIESHDPGIRKYMGDTVWPALKTYSFADALKEKVCMDILGLTYEQCYGPDEEKNSVTHLKWENMPGVITTPSLDGRPLLKEGQYHSTLNDINLYYHKPGPMTAREVMQYVGTEIFRKMYGNVWVDATLRQIEKDNPLFAVIIDCRFPNEVEGVQKTGGKVIRFTRAPLKDDNHESERALDGYEGFDAVIDNAELDIGQQNEALYNQLAEWQLIEFRRFASFVQGESLLV